MKKKAKEKKTVKKIVPEKPKQMPQEDEGTSRRNDEGTMGGDNESPFDFGGIPDRDLKKNLGCG